MDALLVKLTTNPLNLVMSCKSCSCRHKAKSIYNRAAAPGLSTVRPLSNQGTYRSHNLFSACGLVLYLCVSESLSCRGDFAAAMMKCHILVDPAQPSSSKRYKPPTGTNWDSYVFTVSTQINTTVHCQWYYRHFSTCQ